METNQIKCPHCGQMFDVETALTQKLEEHLKSEYEKRYQKQVEAIGEQRRSIEEQQKSLEKQKEQQEEVLKQRLEKTLETERRKIEASTLESFQEQIDSLQQEVDKRKEENKGLKQRELALLKQEQELKEKAENLSLDIERQMLEKQREIEEKARNKERESFELEKFKLLKQIEDNKKLAEEMKRKAELGSMQMQGEVQELALEDLLKQAYPFDIIDEVPKGIKGADSIQTVINSAQQQCGKIVYESKRTKHFANDWIEKLKQDQVTCKADIAVLVTQTFPADMDRFGERNGIWICGFHEVQSLSFVLREMLLNNHSVKLAQENKGDKMELLYTYLTSNEFVQNIRRIVENYDSMKNGLDQEKKAMHKIWAQREKQIWVVQENLSALFGSITGIAGKELEAFEMLQLPDRGQEE